jgi:ferritin
MLIKQQLIEPLNKQIAMEFFAETQYIAIAVYFDSEGLPSLASFFYRQAEEERSHAMKFVHYMLEAGATPIVPALPQPKNGFASPAEAVELALAHEIKVTDSINNLVDLALEHKDHATDTFLRWFVTEQVEEVSSMTNLLQVVKRSNCQLNWVESYVRHLGKE